LDYATFSRAVEEHAALRRRQILQPVGGKGDKIFPPTYPERGAGPKHVFERRRIDGAEVWCVLVDSVQSQANRLEEALLSAVREEAITLPYVTVDFSGKEPRGADRDHLSRRAASGLRRHPPRQPARQSAVHEEPVGATPR
jgi:CRISPR-associated protein Csb1